MGLSTQAKSARRESRAPRLQRSPAMRRRYVWLVFMAVLVLVVAGLVHAAGGWSEIARRVAINRLHAMTGRPVSIERVELELGRGRVAVHGAHVLDRDGASTLA